MQMKDLSYLTTTYAREKMIESYDREAKEEGMRELILKLTILGDEYNDVHPSIIIDDFMPDLSPRAMAEVIEFEVKDFNNIPQED